MTGMNATQKTVVSSSALALAVTLAMGSATQAANFIEVARIDVSSTSNAANAEHIGSYPSAIAWDSGRMYLAGFNAAGATANVGIVEVIDPLGTVSFGTAFGQISTPDTNAVNLSRKSFP